MGIKAQRKKTPVNSADIILYSSIVIGALLLIALVKKEQGEWLKLFLFWGMVIPTVFTTLYLAAATVMENQSSATGGPVHWHADFQIYSCGNAVKLREPSGLSNRIGKTLLHEHGDSRVHVEGAVQDLNDVSLSEFFESIGGQLANSFLILPTDNGTFRMQNNMDCPDGSKPVLQIFAYKTNEQTKTITQEKLIDFPGYILSPAGKVPPGDCLIIEFGPAKAKTEHICGFYQIAINNGDYTYQQ
ncbi:MAG: hypothetical protein A2846_00025 [Candidatus Doudnabacteria bacterium RIFCSPHIGHO2_01_FULL_49_9]|uniref:Uncharacterized protein n=1 Tax=Candidatus Doudnabacteria bacterium RIFCSPHIGHO2_01_FULL_49_9 TaxID=1817827 RepID=A0A1F5P1P0_9BACT|nr:MAG: hypothetical protein A2846_00025 [Candidatus Doudnabacteria bacterium RIFCSPHIGHO2_01_FULL_49_9]